MSAKEIPRSSLPVVNGRIYHLSAAAHELAEYVIIVGDPERVPKIAAQVLESIETTTSHRGLVMTTGKTKFGGLRITIVTSGMGTPSFEIVFNELVVLREIDLETRKPYNPRPGPLTVIRVGTSGAIRQETKVGTSIISAYALGLDNTGQYVDVPSDPVLDALETKATTALRAAAAPGARFTSRLVPYAARAHPDVVAALAKAAEEEKVMHKVGITSSAAGFFANQGRELLPQIRLTVPNIDAVLGGIETADIAGLSPSGVRFENMEMEASCLFHLGAAVGYRTGAICATVAHRPSGTFLDAQTDVVADATRVTVRALVALSKMK